MVKFYRHSNGRVVKRSNDGRFSKFTMGDLFSEDVSSRNSRAICRSCLYGVNEEWRPLLKSGVCPRCSSSEKISEFELKTSNLEINILDLGEAVKTICINGESVSLVNEVHEEIGYLQYGKRFLIIYKSKFQEKKSSYLNEFSAVANYYSQQVYIKYSGENLEFPLIGSKGTDDFVISGSFPKILEDVDDDRYKRKVNLYNFLRIPTESLSLNIKEFILKFI